MMELSGIKYTEQELVQAKMADCLALLLWSKTKDAERGRNKPKLLIEEMLGNKEEKQFEHDVFDSSEDFWKARAMALAR